MDILKLIVKKIDEKKGNNIKVIDISEVNPLATYFVICSVNSDTQATTLANHIEKELVANNLPYHHTEGLHGDRRWVLLDASSVITHIFVNDEREKYDLEKLWLDQPTLDVEGLLK